MASLRRLSRFEIGSLVKLSSQQDCGLTVILQHLAHCAPQLRELVLPLTTTQLLQQVHKFRSLHSLHVGALPPKRLRCCLAVRAAAYTGHAAVRRLAQEQLPAWPLGSITSGLPGLQHLRIDDKTPVLMSGISTQLVSLAALSAFHTAPAATPSMVAHTRLIALELHVVTPHNADRVALSILIQLPQTLRVLILEVQRDSVLLPDAAIISATPANTAAAQLQPLPHVSRSVLASWASAQPDLHFPQLIHLSLPSCLLTLPGDAAALLSTAPSLKTLVRTRARHDNSCYCTNIAEARICCNYQRH